MINSLTGELSLPKDKVVQLIGKMSAAILAVYPAPLHYRSLQALEHKALAATGYDGTI